MKVEPARNQTRPPIAHTDLAIARRVHAAVRVTLQLQLRYCSVRTVYKVGPCTVKAVQVLGVPWRSRATCVFHR